MTRRKAIALSLALAASILLSAARAERADAAVTRAQASAREWSYTLSRLRAPRGWITWQLVNFGEDDHNLYIRRDGGTYTHVISTTHPGSVTDYTAWFRAGTFKLWCGLPGHRSAGMRATFTVYRPASLAARAS
jgi:hypothetical protein